MEDRRWLAVTGTLLSLLSGLALRTSYRLDFYFDEMWRVDMIRSAHTHARYVLHDTPLAPGWLYAMKGIVFLLPDRRVVIRAVALAALPLGLTVWAVVARHLFRRLDFGEGRARLWATVSVALLSLLPGVFQYQTYVNNYGFEVLYVASIVAATLGVVSGGRYAAGLLALLVALAPFMVQSALMCLPPACWVLLDHWRTNRGVRTYAIAALTATAGFGTSAVAYFWFYRPISRNGTTRFWLSHTLTNPRGVRAVSRLYGTELRSLFTSNQSWGIAPLLTVFVCSFCGTLLIARRFPLLLGFIFAGQFLAVVLSATSGWPLTPVRVNLGYTFIAMFVVVFGFCWLLASAIDAVRAQRPVQQRVLAVAVVGICLVTTNAALPRRLLRSSGSGAVFARGLSEDLRTVGRRSTGHPVVVMYHPLSHWYAHDVLTNGSWPATGFTVLREMAVLYNGFDRSVAPYAEPGGQVWCVIPYEVGPAGSDAACRPSTARYREVGRERAHRAQLVLLLVARAPEV